MTPLLASVAGVLVLFVLQTLLAPSLRYLWAGPGVRGRLQVALGPRDQPPPETALSGRAARALANLQEALPVFLTVALLHVIRGSEGPPGPWAVLFLAARVAYVPAYLAGVPGVRSAVWTVGWLGLAGMIVALAA